MFVQEASRLDRPKTARCSLTTLQTVQQSSLGALGALKLCNCRPWEHCGPPGAPLAPFGTLLDPFVSHLATFGPSRSIFGMFDTVQRSTEPLPRTLLAPLGPLLCPTETLRGPFVTFTREFMIVFMIVFSTYFVK